MANRDDKCVIDTNILVYALDRDSPYHHSTQLKIAELCRSGRQLCITEQILREWLVVVTNPKILSHPLSPKSAREIATEIMVAYSLLSPSSYSHLLLLDFVEKYRIRGSRIHDANIVAVMKSHEVTSLWTYNQKDFKAFKEITLL